MTQPKTVRIPRFLISGLTVRTKNSDELNQETAKISGLWQQFYADKIADKILHIQPNSPIFGVYSNYKSDASDFYNLTVGISVEDENTNFDNVAVHEGKYLVFKALGPMPATVVDTWSTIWDYFDKNPQIKRSFLTDFESYYGIDNVQIHIGIN